MHNDSVSLGNDLPLAHHNPAIVSVPPGTEKVDMFPQADKKP